MFPDVFEEVAQRRNDIDWAASFRGSPDLQRFIYRELVESQSPFSEFVDTERLRSDLDAFFQPPPSSLGSPRFRMRAGALRLLGRSPGVFDFAHRSSYYVRKWRGKTRDILPYDQFVIRLLILKVWMDIFLNYPVARTSK
jgi:hypothetical protein